MEKNELKALIKLALCPGNFELSAHDEVCAACPHRGKPECSKQLRHEALALLGDKLGTVSKALDLEERVTEVVHELGIPAHIKGYKYVRFALVEAVERPEILDAITKELYPTVAKEFRTTSSRVERAIRHAIEVAWDRGDLEVLQGYFGNTVDRFKGKPTNSEFLALISERLRMEFKKQEVKNNG